MNELKVIQVTPGQISTNFKEFHEELKVALEDYRSLVVTKANLSSMKKTRQELTRSIKIINDQRKEQKVEYIKPLTAFEDDCKIAIETIKDAEAELKKKIDVYDEEVRVAHLTYAMKVAKELVEEFGLSDKYVSRLDLVKNFANLSITNKAIMSDIDMQVKALAKLQTNEINNEIYVVAQLQTASKLAGLSTELVIDDVVHLIGDYESMDVKLVTDGITSVAMRRKEAEELAIRQAEERIRTEERERAEAKAREEARVRRDEEERILAAQREEAVRLEYEARRKALEEAENVDEEIEEVIEENEEEIENVINPSEASLDDLADLFSEIPIEEFQVIRIKCLKSDTIGILRLLSTNEFDCEVVR